MGTSERFASLADAMRAHSGRRAARQESSVPNKQVRTRRILSISRVGVELGPSALAAAIMAAVVFIGGTVVGAGPEAGAPSTVSAVGAVLALNCHGDDEEQACLGPVTWFAGGGNVH